MAMLGLSLTSTMRVVEATEKEEEVYFQAQTAMRRIVEDLASAISIREAPFAGQNNLVRNRRADSLDFASQARLILNPDKQKAGVARIRYQLLVDQEDERIWKLLRSETLILPRPEAAGKTVTADDAEEPAFLLADSVRAVALHYYDRSGQEFDSWREAGEREGASEARQLPAAVQCTLEFWIDPDKETFQTFSTRVLIPAEPENER